MRTGSSEVIKAKVEASTRQLYDSYDSEGKIINKYRQKPEIQLKC